MDRKRAARIYSILEKEYPDVKTALRHENAFQLMVATILSAQCTDKRVNIVTEQLFSEYKNAKDLAAADLSDIEEKIRSTGFYKNKARNIVGAARKIEKEFSGIVPDSMEDLVTLPGVARKTANIVLFHAFGKNEGIAVDTHVKRLSARLGFSRNDDPVKIERDLMALFDREEWGHLTNILIAHGREVCVARKPRCGDCPVKRLCPSAG
jgi:endonuclease III